MSPGFGATALKLEGRWEVVWGYGAQAVQRRQEPECHLR